MPEVSGVTNGMASGARENNGGADAKCSPPREAEAAAGDMARRPRMQGKFSEFNNTPKKQLGTRTRDQILFCAPASRSCGGADLIRYHWRRRQAGLIIV